MIPVNQDLPSISGSAFAGVTLTASNGSWTDYPSAFEYQWQTAQSPFDTWLDIDGAIASTYTVSPEEVAAKLRVRVKAYSGAGWSDWTDSAATDAVSAFSLPNGLLAYYKLDETEGARADSSGNGNHLTDNNGVGSTPGVVGNATSATVGQWLSSTNALDLSGDFTLSCWSKHPNDGDHSMILVGEYGLGPNISSAQTSIWFGLSYIYNSITIDVSEMGSNVTDWRHIVVTRNAGTLTVWLNGVSIGSTFDDHDFTSRIGLHNDPNNFVSSGQYASSGSIDEVGIWARALSSDEVALLFNNGDGLTL